MSPQFAQFVLALSIGFPSLPTDPNPPRKPIIKPAAKGERIQDKLTVGAAAPDFTLPSAMGGKDFSLADLKGKRPAVLVFASCT